MEEQNASLRTKGIANEVQYVLTLTTAPPRTATYVHSILSSEKSHAHDGKDKPPQGSVWPWFQMHVKYENAELSLPLPLVQLLG